MKYYKVENNDKFLLIGSNYFNEGYNRFSLQDIEKIKKVNKSVSNLAMASSGIAVKFKTNSNVLNVKAKITNRFFMPHLTGVAESGFDLYIYDENENEYLFYNTTKFDLLKNEYDINLYNDENNKEKKFLLYFPLYAKVESLEIGLSKNSEVTKGDSYNKKIVLYGTSIAQGASASRPGMSFSNIISRKLNVEIFNYGFSGQAFLEKEVAQIISKIKDHKLLIIDAEPNAGIDDRLIKNLPTFYNEYRKNHPKTKVLIVSRITYGKDAFDIELRQRREKHFRFLKQFTKNNKNTYFLNGKNIFKENINDQTVDGIHPNDLGMMTMANSYMKKIKKLI